MTFGDWTYTWEHGRQLASMSNPYEIWTFTYDANGMRATRSDGNGGYTYIYNGDQLQEMRYGYDILYFSYDANGVPQTVSHNTTLNQYTTVYQYVTNQQGDVIGIQDYNGNVYASYSYNAWGEPISGHNASPDSIAFLNPLRYRGYVYDTETELYYVGSRYYDPEIGRWINADDYITTNQGILSNNAFAYCLNNPIIFADTSGCFPWLIVGVAVVLSVVAIGIDHALAAHQPKGGYALEDTKNDNGARVRGLYAEGNGFEIDHNGITVCDTEVGFFSATIEDDYLTLEPLDCLSASATAELDWSGSPALDVSAVASIYSPRVEATIPLGLFSITIAGEAYIGAAGVGLELDSETGKVRITPPFTGVGYSFGVDFDLIK